MKNTLIVVLLSASFMNAQVALQSITGTPPNVNFSFGGSQSQLGSSIPLYYAVMANFVGGSVQSNILTVRNGPIVLSSTNYVTLTWLPVSGAASYDVLKLTGPSIPIGTNSIGLHVGITITNSTDTGTATTNYTPAAPPASPVPYISYNSQDYSPAVVYVAGVGPLSGGSGTGTVTSFSSGNLSPLFTTSVATPTVTPALSFAFSNFAADSIFGNFTGSGAAPSTQAIPACANDGAHALVYVSHVLTCETVVVGGTPGGTSGQVQYNNSGAFGGFTTSGDATISTSTGALTLATVNTNTGTCGDATHVGQVTLNAKGLTTACTPVSITGSGSSINAPSTFSSIPACSTTSFYQPLSNSIYSQAYCNGSSVLSYFMGGQQLTPPSGFTWQNQSTATLTTTNGGEIILSAVGANGANVNGRYVAYPTPPFTRMLTARIKAYTVNGHLATNGIGGIYLSDGTQVITYGLYGVGSNSGVTEPTLIVQYGPTVTNITTSVSSAGQSVNQSDTIYLKFNDGLTCSGATSTGNRYYCYSYTNSNFIQFYTEANTVNITAPTRIGYFADAFDTSTYVEIWALGWQ